jgi:dTDP-4-amino-4,6-dideoxygalactose transaminase
VTAGQRIRICDTALVHARTAEVAEAAMLEVLRGGWWVGGPAVARAEAALAGTVGKAHGVGMASGTAALQAILSALGIGPGDDVIVPAVSFVSSATAVLRVGARPVLVDVQPGMPLLDPAAVSAALSPAVKAVVAVSLFGNRVAPIALPDTVPLIDDAAQAMGRSVPYGDGVAQAFSFYPTKVLAASGDGGLVTTDDPLLADRVRALGKHGRTTAGVFTEVCGATPGNNRLDAVQAALVHARLPDLSVRVEWRRRLLARYLHHLPELVLPHDEGSNVAVLVAVHPQRDRLRTALQARGIETGCYYPRPLTAEPVLDAAHVPHPVPNAERFCATCLALPCHIGLSEADIDHVCARIREVLA